MKNKLFKILMSFALILCFINPISADSSSHGCSITSNNTNQIDLESLAVGDHLQQDYSFITNEGVTINSKVDIYVEELKSTRETSGWQDDDLTVSDGKQYKIVWTWDREEEGYVLGGSFTSTNVILFEDGEIEGISTSINAVAPTGYSIYSKDSYFTKDTEYEVYSTVVVETRLLTNVSPIGLNHVIKFEATLCTPNTLCYSFNYKS